jgi:hypothetical protein
MFGKKLADLLLIRTCQICGTELDGRSSIESASQPLCLLQAVGE